MHRQLLVPAVSTFTAKGDVDEDAFAANLNAWLSAGVDGALIAGSSGESALLDDTDRITLIRAARAALPQGKWLLAGIGSESTRQTISRAHDAAHHGADAVLVVSPHYFLKRMTDAALITHFTAVADASPIPVLLYNVPAYAHVVLSPAVVHEMAQHANVTGMKDSAGNLPMLEKYLEAQNESFRVFTGSGATFIAAFQKGAVGAILAIALFAPQAVRTACDLVAAGRAEDAAALQLKLAPLATDIAAAFGPPGIKAAMDLVGLSGGVPRAPLLPVSAGELAIIRARLESAGLLPS